MTVQATFRMQVGANTFLDEEEINHNLEAHRPALLANDNNYGEVVIRSAEPPDIRIDDEVWATVHNLCFGAIPGLLVGKGVTVDLLRYPGVVELVPQGGQVRISGTVIPTRVFQTRELLPALYACGRRYLHFLRRLGGGDANYEAIISHLESQAENARKALGAA
jgi:hypothetical protein